MKILLYRAALSVLWVLGLPILFLLSFKKKYRRAIPARFFLAQKKPSLDREIWFHACSFGEVKSLSPILQSLPEKKILLTTTTQTGYNLAMQSFSNLDVEVRFLPFEPLLYLWCFQNLKSLVVIEAEIWLCLFDFAKKQGARTYLINARISDHSYMRYAKCSFYYQGAFRRIDKIFTQGQIDAIRLKSLGAQNIDVFGNLKVYVPIQPKHLYNKPKRPVIVAASTHLEEEQLILSTYLKLQQEGLDALLIIAPRHPERFNDVYGMFQPFKSGRISEVGINEDLDILLLDLLGDLNSIYRIADVVILCGSFVKMGGHNPIEPAFFETRLISGPYIFNQYALFDCVENYYIAHDANGLYTLLKDYASLQPSKIIPTQGNLDTLISEIIS